MIGLVRTRMMDTHSPSLRRDGVTWGATSVGRAGRVVVVVVVVVVSPGSVDDVVVVVLVVVVVVVSTVVVVKSMVVVVTGPMFGQLVVRTRDVCVAGDEFPDGFTVVDDATVVRDVESVELVVVAGATVSIGGSVSAVRSAKVSAGAAAGGSL